MAVDRARVAMVFAGGPVGSGSGLGMRSVSGWC